MGLLAVASVLAVTGVAVTSVDTTVQPHRYFSDANPILASALICLAGTIVLWRLQRVFGLCVVSAQSNRKLLVAVGAAVPFMASVTLLDRMLGFPSDINVGLPSALVFYPAMGFLAQLSLHVVPFALLLWLLTSRFRSLPAGVRFWSAALPAALPEAIFQMNASIDHPSGLDVLAASVGVQLVLFGVTELYLYRRYDYLSMFVFRLTYYGYWHIVWGSVRVQLP
ncbi:MAG TPA: hypothetical protein VF210_06990 [Pseudomonadales bacterium]